MLSRVSRALRASPSGACCALGSASWLRGFASEAEAPLRPAAASAQPKRPKPPVLPAEAGYNFVMDLTGRGADPAYFRNAHLSEKVREEMYEAHAKDPRANSVEALAVKYRVRQQRILAILTLKKMERQREAAGQPLALELAAAAEQHSGACDQGTGERFVATTPSYPSFVSVPDDLPAEQVPRAGGAAGDTSGDIERHMYREFAERLQRNTAQMGVEGPDAPGAGLWQASRVKSAPSRPKQGWSLLVKPLGAPGSAYVAQPDGSRRELNSDESDLLKGQRIRRRRKLT